MQNKCNCGCQCQPGSGCQPGCGQGFVPASSNWDFNVNDNCDCQQGYARRNRRNACDECKQNDHRTRNQDDCQCERCDDVRQVECCEQNTELRQKKKACTRMADCPCEACTANRARRCNDCTDDEPQRSGRGRKNKKVGMINIEMQELSDVFASESALRAGTLFPELHKPMNGYCPYDGNCGTCQQAAAFAAWELRLYLNTHPNDKEALSLFHKLCQEAEEPNYATSFLTDECRYGWGWVKNPWPWEYDCNCGDRQLGSN